jgi:hypothetical protein
MSKRLNGVVGGDMTDEKISRLYSLFRSLNAKRGQNSVC